MTRGELARKIEGQIRQQGYARVSLSELCEALGQPPDRIQPGAVHLFAAGHGWSVALAGDDTLLTFSSQAKGLTGGLTASD